jgi:hypothetical protein
MAQYTSRYDSHYADMPLWVALHDYEIVVWLEFRLHLADYRLSDRPLNLLPFPISAIEFFGSCQCVPRVASQQKLKCFLGGFEAAGGVKPRRQMETDFMNPQGRH